ncbi:MAG: hypothetical protein H6765_02285 [Candidatus Peribacteria bacterium]|nr:MAG: hypothetical protein H6765_02285 [Candidatus Peribacteria bacterium]
MYYHMSRICLESEPMTDATKLYATLYLGVKSIAAFYPQISGHESLIIKSLEEEIKQFQSTISLGTKKIDAMLSANSSSSVFPGEDAFVLYDTYGVPVELTAEIVGEQGKKVDMA